MKKTKGLLGRWLKNTVSIMLALVLLSATLLSITIGIYYYSEAKNSVETKAYAAQQLIGQDAQHKHGERLRGDDDDAEIFVGGVKICPQQHHIKVVHKENAERCL